MKQPRALSTQTETRLCAYALAAAGSGIGLLALPRPAEAEIIYTPAMISIDNCCRASFKLDLNGDGIIDFAFGGSTIRFGWFYVGPRNDGMIVGYESAGSSACYASALTKGQSIGAKNGKCIFFELASLRQQWDGVDGRYLGLQFKIGGEVHYGWARLDVRFDGTRARAHLTGYAYETIPNQSIRAGQISEDDASNEATTKGANSDEGAIEQSREGRSLGALALGSLDPHN